MTATMNPYLAKTDAFMAPLALIPGVEVYRVGGSVRDEILDRYVKDADYMVRGLELADLGGALKTYRPHAKVSPLKLRDGRQAGWRCSERGVGLIEITLPRKEVSTGPGHRDFEIVLDQALTLEEDAERRDFTFNALYKGINPQGWGISRVMPDGRPLLDVKDPTGRGLYDLQHKLITTTHPDSFRDDPLRTLRALRFMSTLGYDLALHTAEQMTQQAKYVNGLNFNGNASGTIYEEMCKLLMGPDAAKALRMARDTGVLGVLFPELKPMIGFDQSSRYHDMTTDEHVFKALECAVRVDAPLEVRWALLFHDSGKPEAAWVGADGHKHYYAPSIETWCAFHTRKFLTEETFEVRKRPEDHEVVGARLWQRAADRMNIPRKVKFAVDVIILEHMVTVQPKNVGVKVRRARVRLGDDMLKMVLLHRLCDLAGKGHANRSHMVLIGEQEAIRYEAELEGYPASVKDLKINGGDVIAAGAQPGKQVGEVLAAVLDEVVCDPTGMKLTHAWQVTAAARHARAAS